MKILHIINDSLPGTAEQIISFQREGNEVKVIELSQKDVTYESIIDEIFASDSVMSW